MCNAQSGQVRPVHSGTATLKDATSEAIRDWVTNVETTHYILGSAAGPHPYPMMVCSSTFGGGHPSIVNKWSFFFGSTKLAGQVVGPDSITVGSLQIAFYDVMQSWKMLQVSVLLMQVRDFQAVIGREVRQQCMDAFGGKPDVLLACVGGGSNAIGLFHEVRALCFFSKALPSYARMLSVQPANRSLLHGRLV